MNNETIYAIYVTHHPNRFESLIASVTFDLEQFINATLDDDDRQPLFDVRAFDLADVTFEPIETDVTFEPIETDEYEYFTIRRRVDNAVLVAAVETYDPRVDTAIRRAIERDA